jgi:hypothetical protein
MRDLATATVLMMLSALVHFVKVSVEMPAAQVNVVTTQRCN